ncbi:MAG: septum formation initiator family protein [Peptococcales bacterium]
MAYKKAAGSDYIPAPKNLNTHDLHTTREKKKTSRKPGWLLRVTPGIALIVLMFLTGISFVAQHVWLNFLGFQITEIKKEIIKIQTTNEKLQLKIANFNSLEKIEEVAINQLGMIYPDDKTVHYIFQEGTSEDNVDVTQQLAGYVTAPVIVEEEVAINNHYTSKAWLGTVQDFFYHWLMKDS